LAWNVLAETENEATEQDFKNGIEALMAQCSGLFQEQLQGLTSYQLNFLRAVCNGVHTDFGSKSVMEEYNLGSKSNIARIKEALLDRELIETDQDGVYLEDPVFRMWFNKK
jgi:hypothetical protein